MFLLLLQMCKCDVVTLVAVFETIDSDLVLGKYSGELSSALQTDVTTASATMQTSTLRSNITLISTASVLPTDIAIMGSVSELQQVARELSLNVFAQHELGFYYYAQSNNLCRIDTTSGDVVCAVTPYKLISMAYVPGESVLLGVALWKTSTTTTGAATLMPTSSYFSGVSMTAAALDTVAVVNIDAVTLAVSLAPNTQLFATTGTTTPLPTSTTSMPTTSTSATSTDALSSTTIFASTTIVASTLASTASPIPFPTPITPSRPAARRRRRRRRDASQWLTAPLSSVRIDGAAAYDATRAELLYVGTYDAAAAVPVPALPPSPAPSTVSSALATEGSGVAISSTSSHADNSTTTTTTTRVTQGQQAALVRVGAGGGALPLLTPLDASCGQLRWVGVDTVRNRLLALATTPSGAAQLLALDGDIGSCVPMLALPALEQSERFSAALDGECARVFYVAPQSQLVAVLLDSLQIVQLPALPFIATAMLAYVTPLTSVAYARALATPTGARLRATLPMSTDAALWTRPAPTNASMRVSAAGSGTAVTSRARRQIVDFLILAAIAIAQFV
jgi:hypothetical protein